jgi:hypothetical protein
MFVHRLDDDLEQSSSIEDQMSFDASTALVVARRTLHESLYCSCS